MYHKTPTTLGQTTLGVAIEEPIPIQPWLPKFQGLVDSPRLATIICTSMAHKMIEFHG